MVVDLLKRETMKKIAIKRTLLTPRIASIIGMKKSWVLFGLIVALVISVLSGLVENCLFVSQREPEPWMFTGAYATYSGEIIGLPLQYSLNATIEVIELNSTFVCVATNSTIAPPYSPPLTDRSVQWLNKTNISFQHRGETLAATYTTEIPVRGIGVRQCTVYGYTNPGGINSTYYIDNALQWPLRIVYVTAFENQTYTLEFNLNNTNIKGL
jgi:hypothetical protein